MAHAIRMPKLGLTMTEGTVSEWLAAPGQQVQPGDVLLLVETDKTSVEVEAEAAGVVQQVAGPGEAIEVEGVIGWLLAPGEGPVGADEG